LCGGETGGAQRGKIGDHGHAAHAAGEVFEADREFEQRHGVARGGEDGEAQVGHRHEDQADHQRALHAEPGVERASREDAREQCEKTHTDVAERDLVLGEAQTDEKVARHQVGHRVPHLVDEDEKQNDGRALAAEEILEGR
jgi:hypothetical protein